MTKLTMPTSNNNNSTAMVSNNTSFNNFNNPTAMVNNNTFASNSAFQFGAQALAQPMLRIDLNLSAKYLASPTATTILAKTHNGMILANEMGANPFIRFRLKSDTQGYAKVTAMDAQGGQHYWDYDVWAEHHGIDAWDVTFVADLPQLQGVNLQSYRSISIFVPADGAFSDEGIREYNGHEYLVVRCAHAQVQLNESSVPQGTVLSAEDMLVGVQVGVRKSPFALARQLKPSPRQQKKAAKRAEAQERQPIQFNSNVGVTTTAPTVGQPVGQPAPATPAPTVSVASEEDFVELEFGEIEEAVQAQADYEEEEVVTEDYTFTPCEGLPAWMSACVADEEPNNEVPSGTGFGQQESAPAPKAQKKTPVDLSAEDVFMQSDDENASAEEVRKALDAARQEQAAHTAALQAGELEDIEF